MTEEQLMAIRGALSRLQTASAMLLEKEMAESAARRDATAVRNELNDAQKSVDALLAELRKAAPRDTDWAREPGIPV